MSANASAPRHISAPQPALERAPGATIGRAATDRDVTDAIRYAGSIRDGFAMSAELMDAALLAATSLPRSSLHIVYCTPGRFKVRFVSKSTPNKSGDGSRTINTETSFYRRSREGLLRLPRSLRTISVNFCSLSLHTFILMPLGL